jgi:hypothetical protein
MRFVPWHTPSVSAETQAPLLEKVPEAQRMQSFDVPPVQVLQAEEHTAHAAPLGKLPSGHIWFVVVVAGNGSHFVLSTLSCEKPDLHAVH